MPKAALLIVVLAALAACKSTGGTGLTGERLAPQVREASANVITEAEIRAQSFQNAWQAIIALRPNWPKIDGYVNTRRIQYERLQEIPVDTVREIRLLSREQARVRFGPEAQQLIHVITK
ncbi:MAG: hypothetical protein HUU26_11090 [Gemmatimonadaceae bacterium]|nr:hypothetical protein [Gemmatimonadaceae bacterium]